jgi:hypothetical protein
MRNAQSPRADPTKAFNLMQTELSPPRSSSPITLTHGRRRSLVAFRLLL